MPNDDTKEFDMSKSRVGLILRNILLVCFYSALTLITTIVFPILLPSKIIVIVGIVAATFGSWLFFSIVFAWLLARCVRNHALLATTAAGIIVTMLHVKLIENMISLDSLVAAFEGQYGSGTAYTMVYGPYISVLLAFVIVGYVVQRSSK